MRRIRKSARFIAAFLLLQFSTQVFLPSISYALTSGPSQPEFSSFEPVGATNMVDLFTGDLTYNLPVIEVPGPGGSSYPLSLSYHSGTTPEEEASWVGFGWTLNAGAINRGTRGFPDDFKDEPVTYFNKTPKNWTVSAGGGISSLETFGIDLITVSTSASVRYNNYRGFGFNNGVGVALGKGLVSLGYNVSDGGGSFSLDINPAAILSIASEEAIAAQDKIKERSEQTVATNKIIRDRVSKRGQGNLFGSSYGIYSYAGTAKPLNTPSFYGASINISFSVRPTGTPLPFGFGLNGFGSYSVQENVPQQITKGFGYLYSAEVNAADHLADYHVEKETDFNKRDVFLGIPFNDADIFVASGNGINGGFRLYNSAVGHFGPREVVSATAIGNVSVEVSVGLNSGPGTDLPPKVPVLDPSIAGEGLGSGSNVIKVKKWIDPAVVSPFLSLKDRHHSPAVTNYSIDEPVFFKFNNDLGGSWGDIHDDNPHQFLVLPDGYKKYKAVPGQLPTRGWMNSGRAKRSSYIGFNTNKEMLDYQVTPSGFSSPVNYKAFSKRKDIDNLANRTANPDRIGEIAVFNESGGRHVYGLPVYSKSEESYSYGVRGAAPSQIDRNYISYYKNEEFKIGEKKDAAYANSYLITEITTPDYMDVDLNGPTVNDFGGYTKFCYDRVYGGAGTWYKWRMPYQGLLYQKNNLSDKMDDLASVSSGVKEIYYTKSIETKTHVAFFDISTEREDGYGAMDETNSMNSLKKPNTSGDATTQVPKLRRLNRIDLYPLSSVTRDVDGNPIKPAITVPPMKSVIFQYYDNTATESLLKNSKNAKPGVGRLTLKGVYFEYNGTAQGIPTAVKISPYTFQYKYPQTADADYPDAYNAIQTEYNTVASNATWQNPDYSEFTSDAWGNYQPILDMYAAAPYSSRSRFDNMKPWLNQRLTPNVDFDPAAYQLKVIKLPSGGEIHIQYEQDDYAYVQDQPAHVMASLTRPSSLLDTRFYINLASIGLLPGDAQQVCDSINKRYGPSAVNRKKMYFKALVAFEHKLSDPPPELKSCNAEYITGYVDVENAVVESGTVALHLSATKSIRQLAKDFAFATSIGKLDKSDNCDGSTDGFNDKAGPIQLVRQLFSAAQAALMPGEIAPELDLNLINYDLSYFRIPIIKAKKGGGLRVKRLLMFDNTLEGRVLYGNEYAYKVYDTKNFRVISSGVATNEPQTIRQENILVDYIPRIGQSWVGKIIAGRDKKVSEGPLGESILPAPSVGYSRVVVTNIHSGKTNPGFEVNEFYTAKDFPMKVRQTKLEKTVIHDISIFLLFNSFTNHEYASQGFSFLNNDMHGQVKRTASYSGDYTDVHKLAKSVLVAEQSIEYFKPGESVKVMSKMGSVVEKNPGRDLDLTLASKSVTETTSDVNFEADFTVGFFGLVPSIFLTFVPFVTNTEGSVNTHATSKVIHYPAIVKKTTTYQDGIYHTTENLAFDEYTGKPVMVKAQDEFKGAYLTQAIPASWEYPNIRSKAESEDKLLRSTPYAVNYRFATESGKPYLYVEGADFCSYATEIVSGDLLEFPGKFFYHVEAADYNTGKMSLTKSQLTTGTMADGVIDNLWILQTGKNGQLNQNGGSIVFHDPAEANLNISNVTMAENSRYDAANPFSTALQNAVKPILEAARLPSAPTSSGQFTLAGPFTGMNVSAYSFKAPASCTADWSNAKVSSLVLKYVANKQQMTLDLMEFKIDCGGPNTDVLIKN